MVGWSGVGVVTSETRNWNNTLFGPHLGIETVETLQFFKLSKLFNCSSFRASYENSTNSLNSIKKRLKKSH